MTVVLIAPAYSGSDAVCTVCGNAGATTRCTRYAGLSPALLRTCNRCSNTWLERPAPTEPAATGQYV